MYSRELGETSSNNPGFGDLIKHAEAGPIRKVLIKYLFPEDHEKSIKFHKFLGAGITRKLIMSTYGRFYPRMGFSNYRLDPEKSKVEASTRFAVGGSVVNEAIHSVFGSMQAINVAENLVAGKSIALSLGVTATHTALVSLQRYNRARMMDSAEEELRAGSRLDREYTNWLGIDSRAQDSYYESSAEPEHGDIKAPATPIPTAIEAPHSYLAQV